jgi:hypothetical protein
MKNLKCYQDWDAIDATKAADQITSDSHKSAKDFVDKIVMMAESNILSSRGAPEGKKMIFKLKNKILVFTNYRFIQVTIGHIKDDENAITHNHSYHMWRDLNQFDIETATSKGLNSTRNVMLRFRNLERIINLTFDSSHIREVHQFLSSIQVNSILE